MVLRTRKSEEIILRENPELYTAMGGYKYESSVLSKYYTPTSVEQKNNIYQAIEKDKYIRSIQYIADKNIVLGAQKKRAQKQHLTDEEFAAEIRLKWLNGELNSDDISNQIKKEKAIYTAARKLENGEEINLSDRVLLIQNGGKNYTGEDIYKTIDFLAEDNPENIESRDTAEKAMKKQKNNIPLTKEEKADISNYETRRHIQKSIVEDRYALGSDIKKNVENMNTIAAISLYNDAIYETGINKIFNQMQLYTNTGFTKYFQDTINTAVILLTEDAHHKGLTDKRGSDVIKNTPKSMYEIANSAVGEYFTRNNMKFNKFVQDITVNLANNTIPMLLSGVSGGASMATSGLSVFGSSYREAVEMAPEVEEWRYWLYAGMNTSVELCMEKFLSGDKNIASNTGSEFTDAMFKMLSKNISNKMLLGGVYILSNSTGEFFEETTQGLLSPVMQEYILGVDATSILSLNRNEQLNAMKNALYDGMVGFASAGVTTGMFENSSIDNIEQRRMVGEYYNKVFNNLNIDSRNVALYLKEISNGASTKLYKSAEKVLHGDTSNDAVADMMLNGFEQSRESQRFVYTKIGEQLNQNNRYIVYSLIKQYEKLRQSGIELSQSIRDTYNELVNTNENINRETFNFLVGKLSTTMDAVLPRASVVSEITKKISDDVKYNGLSKRDDKNSLIDENVVVEGMWEDSPNSSKNIVEKSQLESVENVGENEFDEGLLDDQTNSEKFKIKPDVIDDLETTLKNQLVFVDDNGQLTFIPTNVIITNTKVIAGADVKNAFRDAKKYVDKYGGNEGDYRKVAGKIESAKYIFDIHFVKDKAGNEYDFKIKSKTLKEGKK